MGVSLKAIIVEDRFAEIFAQLPTISNAKGTEFSMIFKYGDVYELQAFLDNTKGNTKRPYPLIWLLYPYLEQHKRTGVNLEGVQLILATETNAESNNEQRLLENYKKVLIPLYENIKIAFLRANIIHTSDEYNFTKFPNYGRVEDNVSEVNVLWDAIKLNFNCFINDKCLTQIKF